MSQTNYLLDLLAHLRAEREDIKREMAQRLAEADQRIEAVETMIALAKESQ